MFAATYEERLAAWAEAVKAAENHGRLGQQLQAKGMAILAAIPMSEDRRQIDFEKADATGLAKLISNATSAIDRGVRIEREAKKTAVELQRTKPRQ